MDKPYKKSSVTVSDLVRSVFKENKMALLDNALLYTRVAEKQHSIDPQKTVNPETVCRTGRRYRQDGIIYWKQKR